MVLELSDGRDFKTPAQKKTDHARWDEAVAHFPRVHRGSTMEITLKDKDTFTADDVVGSRSIRSAPLPLWWWW